MMIHLTVPHLRRARMLILLAAVALALPVARAQEAGAAPTADGTTQTTETWELLAPLVVERLDNDMVFLLYPTRRAPIVSGVVRFDVGGKDEVPGMTGIAHMFEHMAFKGTHLVGTTDYAAEKAELRKVEAAANAYDRLRNELLRERRAGRITTATVAAKLAPAREAFMQARAAADKYVVKNEFDELYNREGGSQMNASTSGDATMYFISLPANRLPLWIRMESDRLRFPVMREFYAERDVVMEERRMRNDNSPVGRLWELMMATAYTAHPYGYPVIGFESDLANLKADQAYEFFQTHYTPDRGVGVLVGDFDVEETRKLLRETFGKIPARREERSERRIIPEPPQEGERRAVIHLPANPALLLGWHKPALPDPADVRSEVLIYLLTAGRSTRWFESLVKRDRVAAEVQGFTGPGDAEPNMFMIYATPQGETSLDALEKRLREEVAKLADTDFTQEELDRARKGVRANTVRALQDNLGLGWRLAESAQLSGDPWYLERRLRQIEAVSADDLRAFVREYLVDNNLTVGRLEPPVPQPTAAAK